jgi:hypothetical protein
MGKGVDAGLGVVTVLEDCGVNAVETLTQSAINAVNARQNRIGSESSGQISLGSRSAAAGIAIATTLTAAIVATKTAKAATTPAKQQQDDNPPSTVATKAEAVIVVIAHYRTQVGRGHFRGSQTHWNFSLYKIYLCKQTSRTLLSVNIT